MFKSEAPLSLHSEHMIVQTIALRKGKGRGGDTNTHFVLRFCSNIAVLKNGFDDAFAGYNIIGSVADVALP